MCSFNIYTIYFYVRLSGQKSSVVYAVNGVLMTSVFFLCRVANVWYMYNVYAKELGKWKIRKSLKSYNDQWGMVRKIFLNEAFLST